MEQNYFGVALYHPAKEQNVGNVLRTSYNFGAAFVCLITKCKINIEKYYQDTQKSYRHMPIFIFQDYEEFNRCKPQNCGIICIEINENAKNLVDMNEHPNNVIYLFGPEAASVPKDICKCHPCFYIPTKYCLNLATTTGIVLYDRVLKNKNSYNFNLPESKYINEGI